MFRLVAPLALSLCACVSPTSLQTARVLPKGDVAFGGAVELYRGEAPLEDETVKRIDWVPTGEVFIRAGLHERSDCGAKLWPFFVRGDCKLELVRSRWFDAAVGAGLGALAPNPSGYVFDAYLPLYVDLNLWRQPYEAGAVTLIASGGPVGRCYLVEAADPTGCWLQATVSAGVVVQVSEHVSLVTEAAHFRTLVMPGPPMGTKLLRGFQVALGFQFRRLPQDARTRP